jgi:hypothetical protein
MIAGWFLSGWITSAGTGRSVWRVGLQTARPPQMIQRVDDARSLAKAMIRLTGAPQLRARYGMAAKKLLVNKFTAEIIGGELYRPLLGR